MTDKSSAWRQRLFAWHKSHGNHVVCTCFVALPESSDVCLQYDGDMLARVDRAAAANNVLRYIGQVDVRQKTCSVALQVQLAPKSTTFIV